MSTGEVIFATIALIVVAGITAGFWLNLLLWLPMLAVSQMRDQSSAFLVVQSLTMLGSGLTVFLVGLGLIGLPWYAAAIAGVVIALTSYARPAEVPYADAGLYETGGGFGFLDEDLEYDYEPDDETSEPEPYRREKPFACPVCGHRVVTEEGLRQHVAAKHPEAPLLPMQPGQ